MFAAIVAAKNALHAEAEFRRELQDLNDLQATLHKYSSVMLPPYESMMELLEVIKLKYPEWNHSFFTTIISYIFDQSNQVNYEAFRSHKLDITTVNRFTEEQLEVQFKWFYRNHMQQFHGLSAYMYDRIVCKRITNLAFASWMEKSKRPVCRTSPEVSLFWIEQAPILVAQRILGFANGQHYTGFTDFQFMSTESDENGNPIMKQYADIHMLPEIREFLSFTFVYILVTQGFWKLPAFCTLVFNTMLMDYGFTVVADRTLYSKDLKHPKIAVLRNFVDVANRNFNEDQCYSWHPKLKDTIFRTAPSKKLKYSIPAFMNELKALEIDTSKRFEEAYPNLVLTPNQRVHYRKKQSAIADNSKDSIVMTSSNVESLATSNDITEQLNQMKASLNQSEESQLPVKNIIDDNEPVTDRCTNDSFKPEPIHSKRVQKRKTQPVQATLSKYQQEAWEESIARKYVAHARPLLAAHANISTEERNSEFRKRNAFRYDVIKADDVNLVTVESPTILSDIFDDNQNGIDVLNHITISFKSYEQIDGENHENQEVGQYILNEYIEKIGLERLVQFYNDNLEGSRFLKHNVSKYVIAMLHLICNYDRINSEEGYRRYIEFSSIPSMYYLSEYIRNDDTIEITLDGKKYILQLECENDYVKISQDRAYTINNIDFKNRQDRKTFECSISDDSKFSFNPDVEYVE